MDEVRDDGMNDWKANLLRMSVVRFKYCLIDTMH